MKASRQPKVSALLRILAGTCALLWFVGSAVSGIGRVCTCAGHEGACAGHGSPVHEHEAVCPHEQGHSHDAEHHYDAEVQQDATASHHHDGAAPHRCAGKNGCNDKCRCSASIQVLITTMTPVVISKPVSQPVLHISLLYAARQHVFAAPSSEPLRRAKPRDWVFTPEVCLGPALHSLAPPAFV